ncbi:hypothetical protein HYT17_02530 [Candidatus Microgenomates bacterium]|nr:hypothetical protein [Candidatus Microgenomates bacterium]
MLFHKNHLIHYLIILSIIALGIGSVILLSSNKNLQLILVLVVSLFYLCYGIFHHALEHDVTIKIVVEYVLVTLLAVALFIFVRGGF